MNTATTQLEQMTGFLRGDMQAVKFCDDLFALTQTWDDLVDGDREVTPETVNRAFWRALVELPQNPFYQRYMRELHPVLRGFFNDWFDANALEDGDVHERTLSFVLRDAIGGIVGQCAYLVGGYEWMRQVSPDIRRMIHDEHLEDYLRGLK
ncbi:MAG: hypothetical protein ACNI3A_12165 [Desulfovibrio sp.]|uniref:hypothetical protein n=1 Tax=Desulfovibrio sp. 7SRBS1 TaxID=3378064 RepID=UPI003B414076